MYLTSSADFLIHKLIEIVQRHLLTLPHFCLFITRQLPYLHDLEKQSFFYDKHLFLSVQS